MKNKKSFKKYFNIFSKFLIGVLAIFLSVLVTFVFKADIFPIKYVILFIIFALLISIIFGILLWRDNDVWFKSIISLMTLLICVVSALGIVYLNSTFKFINNLKVGEFEEINYNVVTLKSSNYDNIGELKNETIGMLNENSDGVIKTLSSTIYFNDNIVSDVGTLQENLFSYVYKAIVVSDDVLTMLQENKSSVDFEDVTEVIYTFKVSLKVSEDKTFEVNVSKEPFIVYLSGIDQYGKVNTVRGRSDVNIVMVINPVTHKILMINTPRDYYVQLHGKVGLRDKLTHAGIYGIDISVSTLEDLYDVDIDYYLRVNFDTVINVVDVIGGVDVYSDTAFNSSHIKGWFVSKGINHLDGKKALAYSRERYAYVSGDRHRGKNQQDVISAIIKKTSSSKVLLTKYSDILNTLTGSFQSNMPTSMINDFIKYQLSEMPSWNVESISVSGSDAHDYTYSFGSNQKLYVMVPYQADIINAKSKINEVLNAK